MISVTIPNLTYPFKSAISPHAEAVDQSVFEWGQKQGICSLSEPDRYRALGIGQLVVRAYPHASYKELTLIGNWTLWLLTFDDNYDESETGLAPEKTAQIVARLLGILDGTPHGAPNCSVETALADFMQQLTACATDTQRARFTASVCGHLLSMCWETSNRAYLVPPSVAAYQHMRFHSGGVPTCFTLIDVVNNFELTAENYHHPEVSELIRLASNVVCWSNDVLSYAKEAARSSVVHSLPAILQHHHNLEISQAMHLAVEMHNDEVKAYVQAEEPVRRWASQDLCRFLDGLHYWMTGNLGWSLASGRYGMTNSTQGMIYQNSISSPSETIPTAIMRSRTELSA